MKNAPTINQDSRGIATQQRNATTKPSLRSAINAMCRHCIYDPNSGSGTWRQQATACTSKTCPLYDVRPKPAPTTTQVLNAPENPENDHFDSIIDREKMLP